MFWWVKGRLFLLYTNKDKSTTDPLCLRGGNHLQIDSGEILRTECFKQTPHTVARPCMFSQHQANLLNSQSFAEADNIFKQIYIFISLQNFDESDFLFSAGPIKPNKRGNQSNCHIKVTRGNYWNYRRVERFYFRDERNEAQRGKMTGLRSQRWRVAGSRWRGRTHLTVCRFLAGFLYGGNWVFQAI